jgi:hypothetical protein
MKVHLLLLGYYGMYSASDAVASFNTDFTVLLVDTFNVLGLVFFILLLIHVFEKSIRHCSS